jgi:outer membrane protein assembly factor BamB
MKLNIILITCALVCFAQAENYWPGFAHDASQTSIALDGLNSLDQNNIQWTAYQDPCNPGYYLEFNWLVTPVTYKNAVFALAELDDTNNQLICFNTTDGSPRWSKPISKLQIAYTASRASPAIDKKHNAVIIPANNTITAFNIDTGTPLWTTQLQHPVINASPCITDDLQNSRLFITDYTGRSTGAKIYCVNIDANTPQNPYDPGHIIWSDDIGASSGNTCAYNKGIVYTASISSAAWANQGSAAGGTIYAYNAAENEPNRIWQTSSDQFEGFCGGLCLTKAGFLYAVNYDFYGGENNSALTKINATDGSIVWITQAERSSTTPVVVGDTIYLSAGITGFNANSRPKLQAFQDNGDSATMLWQTPPTMTFGGWTLQPVYANGKIYIGTMGPDEVSPCSDLYIIDANLTPTDPDFIIDHFPDAGSPAAVTPDSIYTIGYDGLFKFYQPAIPADITKNKTVDNLDLTEIANDWLYDGPIGIKRADLDLDGIINLRDIAILSNSYGEQIQ